MNEYTYVDYLAFGEEGDITEFTWGEVRSRRPRWQRLLRWLVPAWRSDIVLRRVTDPFDLPIWIKAISGSGEK